MSYDKGTMSNIESEVLNEITEASKLKLSRSPTDPKLEEFIALEDDTERNQTQPTTSGNAAEAFVDPDKVNANKGYIFGSEALSAASSPTELIGDLEIFYEKGIMSDIEILVEGNTIKAHKLMLYRSPIFQRMMEKDSKLNQITITDCDEETFKIFLKYLYTGKVYGNNLDTVTNLFTLGERYEVRSLRMKCFCLIKYIFDFDPRNLPFSSLIKILRLTDRYKNKILKHDAIDFFVKRYSEIDSTDEWKTIMREDHELILEVLKAVTSALKDKEWP